MKGIPVRPNGVPVRVTRVIAGNYHQFRLWCQFSAVNPQSGRVKFVSSFHDLLGLRDIDVVFTGTGYADEAMRKALEIVGVNETYIQRESADIEPNIVAC